MAEKETVSDDKRAGQWLEHLMSVQVRDSDLNAIVMNYLMVGAYADTLKTFIEEAGIGQRYSMEAIKLRTPIAEAILNGNIDLATKYIDDICPSILNKCQKIRYLLLQETLIQFIKKKDVSGALEHVRGEMRPLVSNNPELMPHLESAMSLLAFSDPESGPALQVLQTMLRPDTLIHLVDECILNHFGVDKSSTLGYLVRACRQGHKRLTKNKIPFIKLKRVDSSKFAVSLGTKIDDPSDISPPADGNRANHDRNKIEGSGFDSSASLAEES